MPNSLHIPRPLRALRCFTALASLATLPLVACASAEQKPDEAAPATEAAAPEEPEAIGPPPEGTVAVDTSSLAIEPAGGMSRGAAARAAIEGSPSLQSCYRERLRDDGALALQIGLDVEIDAEGRAAMKAASGDDAGKISDELRTCLTDAISRWPYDWPNEPVVVTYPVTFTPAAAG